MAQSILARLGVVMTVDSAEFKKGLDEATIKSRAFQNELKKQNKESAAFGKEAAAVLGKVASVAALAGAAIIKAWSYGAAIKDVADSMNITIQSIMRMREAMSLAGKSADDMTGILNKLVLNQQKAKDGAQDVRDAFTKLGISGGEVEEALPDELFSRIAYQLSQIEDPAKRNAQAFELLGKAAKGVIWKDYWEAYGQGKNVSDNVSDSIRAGAEAFDNLKLVGSAALKAILILAKPLADLINRFANAVKTDPRIKEARSERDLFNLAKDSLQDDPAYLKASQKERQKLIQAKIEELRVTKEIAKTEEVGIKPLKGASKGYKIASKDDNKSASEIAGLKEAFKIRVEQLSTISQTIARETELIGMTEEEAERAKLRYALEDENLKMQLDLERQIAVEKAKGADANREKIRLLEDEKVAYGVLIDMARTSAEEELRIKEQKIRSQQILTNTEKEGMNQLVDNFAVLGQQSKAAFAAWKAFSIVNAIIDTYTGAQKAFTSLAGIPIVGPALGGVAAAVAIAAGMARVNMIRNQQYQGREKGGSMVANTPYIVGERGPELVIPHRGGTVIPNNQLSSAMSGGGGVTYNGPYIANMSAIDTQSAMDFLAKNKQGVWAANIAAQRSLPSSR